MADPAPRRLERMDRCHLPGGGTIFVARTVRERLLGLMGLPVLPLGSALLFPGCNSVHTAWMRMAIDVVFLDADGCALEVRRDVRPWRTTHCRGARAVLECPAGGADALLSERCCRAATRP